MCGVPKFPNHTVSVSEICSVNYMQGLAKLLRPLDLSYFRMHFVGGGGRLCVPVFLCKVPYFINVNPRNVCVERVSCFLRSVRSSRCRQHAQSVNIRSFYRYCGQIGLRNGVYDPSQ